MEWDRRQRLTQLNWECASMKNIEIHLVINAFSLGLTADKITYTTLMKALIRPEKLDEGVARQMEKQKTCFAFAVLSESLCHQKTNFCGEGVLDPWMFATFEAEKFLKIFNNSRQLCCSEEEEKCKAEEEEDSLGLILLQVKGWKKLGFLFKAHLFGSSPTHHPTYDNAHVLLRIGFFRLVPPAGASLLSLPFGFLTLNALLVLDLQRLDWISAGDLCYQLIPRGPAGASSTLMRKYDVSSSILLHQLELLRIWHPLLRVLMRGGNRTVRSTMHVTHGPSMEREKQTKRKARELKNAPGGIV
ncbi:hypothetical protein SELMODRAFT_421365 [Selaginella moellendorffii]|uniref:Uncharacterized protein n=1 Tax=Selaginella moellendorffii TaxID=88036 RepID=D8SF17_SELML|nr:hypothetical protein SELMODRAFT_421365 [Selaginella moellendorffii]